ncbi:Uncharacterized protein Anas_08129 [Armadillidium nasatum]|uniref:Uncharacterized protein n=1 Tax=Armadillidium nasatum TaxID=96803 RepID=A0A5N5SY43_9CRUS|nr:Uncharacterized protein Anas_08129 [Armadillidium nasatum]
MPHNYTRTDQVRFLTEWFDSWSEMQKEDFLPIIIQAINPGDHVNGIVGGVRSMRVGERRPSLFDCQIKLFQDWYEHWTAEEKQRLLNHITSSDPEFAAKLHKSNSESGETNGVIEVDVSLPSSAPVEAGDDDNKDDGVSPGSHSSSPLSSLSQTLSPHDSGLEENHLDLEHTTSQQEVTKEINIPPVQTQEATCDATVENNTTKSSEIQAVTCDIQKEI